MSASAVKKLGVIAGGGALPAKLLHACDCKDIVPFVVGFEGQTDHDIVEGRNHVWSRLGAVGQIFNTLKSHDIQDVVLIGSIHRPALIELRPDVKGAEILARIGIRALGDNDLLSMIRDVMEEEGFTIRGVQEFADNLLAPAGQIGRKKPRKVDWVDIWRGVQITQTLGVLDVGQAAIIEEGIVLGVEGIEGTDELIRRCKNLKRKSQGGVLVKTCKPQQDRNLDLPTIGHKTIELAADCGLAGVAIHAGESLLLDPQRVAQVADKAKLFVIGIDPAEIPK